MNSFIDRKTHRFTDFDARYNIAPKGRFVLMILVSIVLHLAISTPFFISGQRGTPIPPVPLVDLSLIRQSAQPVPPPPAMKKPHPEQSAAPAVEPRPPAAEQNSQPAAETATSNPLQQTSFGLGISRGYFKSIADGQSLRPDIRDYYFAVLDKINDSWWKLGSIKQKVVTREPVIDVWIARNGEVVNKSVLKSSGSPAYDRMMLEAVDAAAPFPALPESYAGDYFEAPVRLVTPRGVMLGEGLF